MDIFEKLNINLPQEQKDAVINSLDYSLRHVLLSRAAVSGHIEDLPYGMKAMIENCEGEVIPTLRLWLARCPETKIQEICKPLESLGKDKLLAKVNAVVDGFKQATVDPAENRKILESLENLKWQFDYSHADIPFKLTQTTCAEILEQSRQLMEDNLNNMFASSSEIQLEIEPEN